MTGIRAKLVLFIGVAAVAPLLVYAVLSVRSLRTGMEQTVATGHLEVARQVAARFREYFENTERILNSIGSQVQGVQLASWQRDRILLNHALDFPELREIAVFDGSGRREASSRPGSSLTVPVDVPRAGRLIVTPPELDGDQLPTARIAVPLRRQGAPGGWLVAEITLEELWREVDTIRLGEHGHAALIDQNGRFVAHGDPDQKRLVANRVPASDEQLALAARVQRERGRVLPRLDGGRTVAVAARIGTPDWTVIIEQPEWEALGVAHRLTRQLYFAIALALLATLVAGYWLGGSFIRRILALTAVTDALAQGQMKARVSLEGRDEIAQLGERFNTMADRLVELQERNLKQQRHMVFGRIAAGLVHDLLQPVQVIGQQCKMIQRLYDDPEYREGFRQTITRELATVQRVLDDLLNIARPRPLERFSVDVHAALREIVSAMTPLAATAGVTLDAAFPREPLHIEADVFSLGRVHRNLIINAIQATAPGGRVTVSTAVRDEHVLISVMDTGCGIPPERLQAIFDDFVTTKGRGLGLGLAISKTIVEQLGGRISVGSEIGRGTTFVLTFPRAANRPMAAAG